MLTATPPAMARIFRAVFLFFPVLFLGENAFAQGNTTTSSNTLVGPDAKSFAAQYLKRKELKEYDWDHANANRNNDTGNILFFVIKQLEPKGNELKYILAHCTDNKITELVKHSILFADTSAKLHPLSIRSASLVCKSESEIELQQKANNSGNFYSKDSCAECKHPFVVVIKGRYINGKVEKTPPVVYVRVPGALLAIPASCSGSFSKKSDWIAGWDIHFNLGLISNKK
jgi:hypothetical protein